MKATLDTAAAIKPVTLAELKAHLRIDSQDFADDQAQSQSLVPDNYAIGNHEGAGVDVSGKQALVILNAGTVAATCTVDAKIQESDDDVTYTDWTGGSFTQVTTANDNAIQEKEYTGSCQYIRVYAAVAADAGDFSATVITDAATAADDTYLTGLIAMATEQVEGWTNRALITQTWKLYLDSWPADAIELPFGSLQSVTSVKYTDTDGTENTWSSAEYDVDTDSTCGRIKPAYGESWPTAALDTMNPIEIEFVCGYGDATTSVPESVRLGILMLAAGYYIHREPVTAGQPLSENSLVANLLLSYCIWRHA